MSDTYNDRLKKEARQHALQNGHNLKPFKRLCDGWHTTCRRCRVDVFVSPRMGVPAAIKGPCPGRLVHVA